jgi:polyisoprenoid-binding protein YceI
MRLKKSLSAVMAGVFLAGLAFAVAAQENPYEDLLGTWDVQTEDGQYTFVFVFALDKEELKGTFTGTSGEVKMENLEYKDGKLKFLVNVGAGGQNMAITFTAAVTGEKLSGMLSLQFGEANIIGKKRK